MNTSLKWIKALVPGLDCGVQEYVDAMTLSGSKVEGYEQLDADLDKIVVGQVTKIEKTPGCRQTCHLPGKRWKRNAADCDRCTKRI